MCYSVPYSALLLYKEDVLVKIRILSEMNLLRQYEHNLIQNFSLFFPSEVAAGAVLDS